MEISESLKSEIFLGFVNGLLLGGVLTLIFLIYSSIKLNTPLYFLVEYYFIATTVVVSVLIFILVFKRKLRHFNDNVVREYAMKTIISLFFIFLALQFLFIGSIESKYQTVKGDYFDKYQNNLEKAHGNQLSALWNITTDYTSAYDNTYGTSIGSPSRTLKTNEKLIELSSLIIPTELLYIYYFGGLNKITVIQNQGRCGEFAEAQSFFINDISGLKTRIIYFVGADHEFPEVYVNCKWYVFDKSYTTTEKPVEAEQYADFLREKHPLLFTNITGLKSSDEDSHVYQDHGFEIKL